MSNLASDSMAAHRISEMQNQLKKPERQFNAVDCSDLNKKQVQ